MKHGFMVKWAGGERPLEPSGDLSEQHFFFGEAFLFLARKRNGSNTLLCNNKFFIWGHIHSRYILFLINKILYIKFIYWTLRAQMIVHLTRRINAPFRCSLNPQHFYELNHMNSEYLFSRQFTKSTGKLQGFFFCAWSAKEISGGERPLEPQAT